MASNPYRFNREAKYKPGPQNGAPSGVDNLTLAHVQVQPARYKYFKSHYTNVFEKYRLPLIRSDHDVKTWYEHPMQHWQCQLNFAVWCSTSGCGVSYEDHISAEDPLLSSVYRFHVYYTIRRILAEIQAPLPQDHAWNPLKNPYDRRGYERICNEFGVSPHSDWRVSGPSRGLGRTYQYWTNMGYHPVPGDSEYDPGRMSFTKRSGYGITHVDYIKQDAHNADTAWSTFILDKSDGFTRPGVERVNDSIRTYVWAVLGAQSQTRTGILGTGTAFDAQKQFLANIEDAIESPVDLPTAIKRYQNVLQYARSVVNFSFGVGLYMAPSDMLLRVARAVGYNNLIVIATDAQSLGLNNHLNAVDAPPDAANDTGETGLVKPPTETTATVSAPPEKSTTEPPSLTTRGESRQHEEEKTALVVGGVAVGLLALWRLR